MLLPRPLLLLILLPFAAYSSYVLYEIGYVAIWTSHLHVAGLQVLADLIIACTLALAWIWRDAARCGRVFWPYALLTLTMGSFGPLLYLLLSPSTEQAGQRSRPVRQPVHG